MSYMLEALGDTKLGLAAEVLRGRGTLRLKVGGMSMLPAVWPGDLITIQSVAHAGVVPGDIVLVLRDNRFFVHRLVERRLVQDCLLLITRGDAVPRNDPPAAASKLLGRVTLIRRGNRTFVPKRRVSLLQCTLAWVFCHWDRFRNLALTIHAASLRANAARAGQFFWGAFGRLPTTSDTSTSRTSHISHT